jgi:hypothetical protein
MLQISRGGIVKSLSRIVFLTALFTSSMALAQQLASTPATVNFGAVAPGSTQTVPISLINNGTASLTIQSITFSAGFSGNGIASGEVFPPGGGSDYGVTFTAPQSGGPFNGTMIVTSNGPTLTVPLTASLTGGTTTPPPVVTPPPVTTPPALFCATDPNPACGVVLTWKAPPAPSDATLAVTGYLVFRSTSSTAAAQITAAPITAVTYTDKTIAPSTTYDYYVVSVDAAGAQSAPSNTLQVIVAAAPSVPTPATPTNLTGSVVN